MAKSTPKPFALDSGAGTRSSLTVKGPASNCKTFLPTAKIELYFC